MVSLLAVKAVDRSLRDLMACPTLPFGGKIVVFGGDFRQLLPVVPGGTDADIQAVTLNNADFWNQVHIMRLTQNMRISSCTPVKFRGDFAQFLMRCGNGIGNDIKIQPYMRIDAHNLRALIHNIYPNLADNPSPAHFKHRAIIAPLNVDVDAINAKAIELFPSDFERVFPSFDSVVEDGDDPDDPDSYSNTGIETLNDMNPSGFPKHKLIVKTGMPMIILRNISLADGLCNGT